MDTLDHTFLNELGFFDGGNPSSENIASYIAKELEKLISDDQINVSRITVWESENASATYIP
jgi:6-pyruvoyltetrahydropterin/6-carboxytetrahydropterin synthase